jgi:hypothetical protein
MTKWSNRPINRQIVNRQIVNHTKKTLTLTRQKKEDKAVNGTMTFDMYNRDYELETFSQPTLENADFLIPAGTYPVERTWSPKFKKFLPLISVPDREGIRIHRGSIPEHSHGCVLTDLRGMANIDVLFNQIDQQDNETVQLIITDQC